MHAEFKMKNHIRMVALQVLAKPIEIELVMLILPTAGFTKTWDKMKLLQVIAYKFAIDKNKLYTELWWLEHII